MVSKPSSRFIADFSSFVKYSQLQNSLPELAEVCHVVYGFGFSSCSGSLLRLFGWYPSGSVNLTTPHPAIIFQRQKHTHAIFMFDHMIKQAVRLGNYLYLLNFETSFGYRIKISPPASSLVRSTKDAGIYQEEDWSATTEMPSLTKQNLTS